MPGEPQGSLGPDEEGRESSPVYHLVVASGFGRIWTTRPTIQQDGLLTVLRSSSGRQHKAPGPGRPCFTAVAFSCRAETLATVDNCGNVFLFHITK